MFCVVTIKNSSDIIAFGVTLCLFERMYDETLFCGVFNSYDSMMWKKSDLFPCEKLSSTFMYIKVIYSVIYL